MERNLTFQLDSVISGREDMEDFEGPLTLLLHLIQRNKVAIADIQIGEICDQYIAYLEQMKEMDLEVASAFVQMASHLVYIKARALLSADREIPELEQLLSSMEDLQCRAQQNQIRGVLELLETRYIPGGGYMEKPPEPQPLEDAYQYSHQVLDLLEAMSRMLRRETDFPELIDQPFIMPTPLTYSVTEKAQEIITRLKQVQGMNIRALFDEAGSRSEIVATFIAILELCKVGSLRFEGEGTDLEASFTGVEAQFTDLDTTALEIAAEGEE